MSEQEALDPARKAKEESKSASTQALEFVREEIHHIREGRHGARSTKQVIAIGLTKARRAGVKLKPTSVSTKVARSRKKTVSAERVRASARALQHEGRREVSHRALSRQARASSGKKKVRLPNRLPRGEQPKRH